MLNTTRIGLVSSLIVTLDRLGISLITQPEVRLRAASRRGAMLVKIQNQARDYAWGSQTLISDYFGFPETGKPMAEIWFGTHPGSLSVLSEVGDETLLHYLGGHQLSFLLKILAADQPLSIQAHPNTVQAVEGFERECELGLAQDDPKRNYKDSRNKPELIVALSPFEALCGFRPVAEIDDLFRDLQTHAFSSQALREVCSEWLELLAGDGGIEKVFVDVSNRRGNFDGIAAELSTMADFDSRFALAERLNAIYPGDPGVLIALLMNHIHLEPGESLFVPPGMIHAYLNGLGVEVMAASDNVLRGGLTPKHIDLPELQKILDFTPGKVSKLETDQLSSGLVRYPCATSDFLLYRAEPSGQRIMTDLNLPGEAIILCTAGEVEVSTSKAERLVLRRGEAAYLSAEARFFSLAGSGTAFLATSAG